MAIEIERKFLVKGEFKHLATSSKLIKQLLKPEKFFLSHTPATQQFVVRPDIFLLLTMKYSTIF